LVESARTLAVKTCAEGKRLALTVRKPIPLSSGARDSLTTMTAHRRPEDLSDNDYTHVDLGADHAATGAVGYVSAITEPFSGTPTPFDATGPISSGEITAQNARAAESAPPPNVPASIPDPTDAVRLDSLINLVPGTLVGEFEVEKLLGSGAMGQVYGARHERLRKRGAIKVIAPNLSADRGAVERFEQEAHALARLSHPNVVAILNVGTLPGDGRSYYVMEWIDGESLQTWINRGGSSLDHALDILDQIARGLEAAHEAGIVHRDLKPDNVWLQRVGNEPLPIVKILDFGLSKLSEHRRSEETAVGVMFGTPDYMSPEQCQSARDVGPATDVYALGAVAYELLCGRLPFVHDNIAELIVAHQFEEPPHPRELKPAIDPRLDALMFAMLAKDPARRPTLAVVRSSIATVRKQFLSRAFGTPAPQTSSSTITAPRATAPAEQTLRSRRRIVVAAVWMLVLLLSFLVASLVTPSNDDRRSAEGRAVPRIDASATSEPPPAVTASPPAIALAPTVGVRDALPKAPERARTATRTASPPALNIAKEVVDAGLEAGADVDAGSAVAVEIKIDAAHRADESQGQPAPEREPPAKPEVIRRPTAHAPSTSDSPMPGSTSSPSPARAATDGTLSLDSKPRTDVRIDGEHVGRTPIVRKLSVGRHNVTLRNPTYGIAESYQVEIRRGQVSKIDKDLRDQIPEAKKTVNPFRKKGSASP
jgi:serine/threonine protein kinase